MSDMLHPTAYAKPESPATFDEASWYHQGLKAWIARYAVGHSTLKGSNDALARCLDDAGREVVEIFERLSGMTT